jgi:sugar phosphate isomerase/epimerase
VSGPRLTLGLNLSVAAKRWPVPRLWTVPVRAAQLRHVQFSLDLLDPLLPRSVWRPVAADVRAVAANEGIRLDSVLTGLAAYGQNLLGHPDHRLRRAARDMHLRAIELAAVLGARGYGGHLGARPSPVGTEDATGPQREWLEEVAWLAGKAHDAGLDYLLWEPMPVAQEPPHTRDEARRYMETLEGTAVPVRLCLDLGHMCAPDTAGRDRDPLAWLSDLGPYVRCLHLQQTDGLGDRHWPFWDRGRAVEGIIRPEAVLTVVRSLPAPEVDLVLEPLYAYERPDAEVLASLTATADTWQRILASHPDQGGA